VSPEQFVAIVVALTGAIAAVGVVLVQLAQLRREVNGRLTQLLEETREQGRLEGELRGRDHVGMQLRRVGDTPISTPVPLDTDPKP
jgi:hypothetical protein